MFIVVRSGTNTFTLPCKLLGGVDWYAGEVGKSISALEVEIAGQGLWLKQLTIDDNIVDQNGVPWTDHDLILVLDRINKTEYHSENS